MMSHEEQVAQHDSIKNIEEAVAFSIKPKQLYNIVIGTITLMLVAFTAFWKYDTGNHTEYAKGKDVVVLSDKLDKLTSAVNNMLIHNRYKDEKDSLSAVEIKKTVLQNREEVSRNLSSILRQCKDIKVGALTAERTRSGDIIFHKYTGN